MKSEIRKSALSILVIVLALFMTACSTNQSHREMPPDTWRWADGVADMRSDPQHKQLMERFSQFWSHYYWREMEQRYQMELPAFQKRFSKDFYVGYYSKAWDVVEFSVNAIEEPKAGEAVFHIGFKQRGKQNGKITVMENPLVDVWVLEDGIWYHKANDPMLRY